MMQMSANKKACYR